VSGPDAFEKLRDDLLARNADLERTKMTGMLSRYAVSLKTNGKFVATEGAMELKLEDASARGQAVAPEGAHLFDPGGHDGPVHEWVVFPPALSSRWAELAARAPA